MSRKRALEGHVVAVTGAGSGIGKATAATLADQGARVVIGDLEYVRAERLASAINHTITPDGGGVAIALALDVRDPESFQRFLDEGRQDFGPLDVLVNDSPCAVQTGMELVVPRMVQRANGHVLNISPQDSSASVLDSTAAARLEFEQSGVAFTAVVTRADPPVEADLVAAAVVAAIRSRPATVHVPGSSRAINRACAVLPLAVRRRIYRKLAAKRRSREGAK